MKWWQRSLLGAFFGAAGGTVSGLVNNNLSPASVAIAAGTGALGGLPENPLAGGFISGGTNDLGQQLYRVGGNPKKVNYFEVGGETVLGGYTGISGSIDVPGMSELGQTLYSSGMGTFIAGFDPVMLLLSMQ